MQPRRGSPQPFRPSFPGGGELTMSHTQLRQQLPRWVTHLILLAVVGGGVSVLVTFTEPKDVEPRQPERPPLPRRQDVDDGGYSLAIQFMKPWADGTSLEQ